MRAPKLACLLVLGLLSTRSTALPVALRDGNVKAVSRANVDTSISPHARDDAFPNWAKAVVGGAGAIIVGAGMYFGGKSLVKYLGALERERVDKVSVFPEQVYGG